MVKRNFDSQGEEWEAQLACVEREAKRRKLDLTAYINKHSKDGGHAVALSKFIQIVRDIQQDNRAKAYLKIDRNAPWFAGYARQIKTIMDFDIIKRKFNNNEYKDVYSAARDFRLVWDNAMTFNAPNEVIYRDAWHFLKKFEERFAQEIIPIIGESEQGQKFHRVVQGLFSHSKSDIFKNPVDYKALNLHTYPRMVNRPFCLLKVKHRCFSYTSKQEFLRDLNQVFDNAILFNGRQSSIGQDASMLKKMANDQLTKLLNLQQEDTNVIDEPDSSDCELTQEEMEWLSEHFYDLDEDRIEPIVTKLSEYSKADDDGEEPTIDLQELPKRLLRDAFNYVKDSLKIQKQMNEGAGISTRTS